MILELKDGGIIEIYSDSSYEPSGCETCDWGSRYISNYTFELKTGEIHIGASKSFDYPLSEGYMMKLMLSQVNEIREMTEKEFFDWLVKQLHDDLGEIITHYEWLNK